MTAAPAGHPADLPMLFFVNPNRRFMGDVE
jgi:hypothetical protein